MSQCKRGTPRVWARRPPRRTGGARRVALASSTAKRSLSFVGLELDGRLACCKKQSMRTRRMRLRAASRACRQQRQTHVSKEAKRTRWRRPRRTGGARPSRSVSRLLASRVSMRAALSARRAICRCFALRSNSASCSPLFQTQMRTVARSWVMLHAGMHEHPACETASSRLGLHNSQSGRRRHRPILLLPVFLVDV